MKCKILVFISVVLFCYSCSDDVLPKPKAQLRLEYPENTYQKVNSDCPYLIEINQNSEIVIEKNCWAKINYPKLNASIHLTYREINDDINLILREVERLTYEHAIKADNISPGKDFKNDFKKVYGKIVNVEGNVASNIQFHVTDSVKNMLYGTLYFNVKPNYDSILPALSYIEKDIRNLMESVEWQNNYIINE